MHCIYGAHLEIVFFFFIDLNGHEDWGVSDSIHPALVRHGAHGTSLQGLIPYYLNIRVQFTSLVQFRATTVDETWVLFFSVLQDISGRGFFL